MRNQIYKFVLQDDVKKNKKRGNESEFRDVTPTTEVPTELMFCLYKTQL